VRAGGGSLDASRSRLGAAWGRCGAIAGPGSPPPFAAERVPPGAAFGHGRALRRASSWREAPADRGHEAVQTAALHFCCDRRRPKVDIRNGMKLTFAAR